MLRYTKHVFFLPPQPLALGEGGVFFDNNNNTQKKNRLFCAHTTLLSHFFFFFCDNYEKKKLKITKIDKFTFFFYTLIF